MVEEQKVNLTKEEKDAQILKHMKNFMDDVNSLDDLEQKDISGFANSTVIVSHKKPKEGTTKPTKLVVRFFQSAASDFAAETATFRLMGEKGLGPKEYYVDERVRVEECINGRALHMTELRNPIVLKACVEAICDMNYDPDLIAASKKIKGDDQIHFRDFISEQGWFTFAQGLREQVGYYYVDEPQVKGIQEYLDNVLKNPDEFKKEYAALLPKTVRPEIDLVFSHNDFQENNAMIDGANYNKVVLIDFEFSSMNYRGADLAALFNEIMITYAHMGELPLKVYHDWMLSSEELDKVLEIYLNRYHSKWYKGDKSLADFLKEEKPILLDQVQRCILLSHPMWAFGTLLLIPDASEKPLEYMGYNIYAWTRLEMLARIKKHFLGEHLNCLAVPIEE